MSISLKAVAPGEVTKVAVVKVGRPVRRVRPVNTTLSQLADIDITSLTEGSVLVYKQNTGKWNATLDLEDQNLNGGSY